MDVDNNRDEYTYLFLSNKDCDRRIQSWTQSNTSRSFNSQFIHDALVPLCRSKDLNIGPDQSNGMGLRNCILEVPTFLRLLSERDELLTSRDRPNTEVFML